MSLYLVPVPIGNLRDITLRALDILADVDFIVAEDSRVARKLLNFYEIKKDILSYYKPKEKEKAKIIVQKLKNGQKVALISDAGSPCISDPGEILIKELIKEQIEIIPLPGATAFVPALSVSGLNTNKFVFWGFPPRKKGERHSFLNDIKNYQETHIFYKSPKRVKDFLLSVLEIFGDRKCSISREISKIHEEHIRGNISEVLNKDITFKGEFVLIIEGKEILDINSEDISLNCRKDIVDFFKKNFGISANVIREAWQKK